MSDQLSSIFSLLPILVVTPPNICCGRWEGQSSWEATTAAVSLIKCTPYIYIHRELATFVWIANKTSILIRRPCDFTLTLHPVAKIFLLNFKQCLDSFFWNIVAGPLTRRLLYNVIVIAYICYAEHMCRYEHDDNSDDHHITHAENKSNEAFKTIIYKLILGRRIEKNGSRHMERTWLLLTPTVATDRLSSAGRCW
jgi:hypothetical protein